MEKKIKILIALFVIIVLGYFGYNYIMTGGGREIATEKSEFTTTASKVFEEFSTNAAIATTKYLNRTVEISGKVTGVENNVISLDEKVSCQLQATNQVKIGCQISIKGRVTGYDDLLEELKLDQCLIVK